MRLQRVGRRNDPSYRVVVTDKRTGPKSNKHVAILGSYNPKLSHVQLEGATVQGWLAKGVQPSPTVHNLLISQGIIKGKKVNVLPRKSPIVDEEAEAAKVAEAEAAAAKKNEETTAEADSSDSEETPADTADADTDATKEPEAPAEEKTAA